jgi:hypothetical protein
MMAFDTHYIWNHSSSDNYIPFKLARRLGGCGNVFEKGIAPDAVPELLEP